MTNGQTGIGRRAVLGGVAAAGTATYLQRAWAADSLKQVPRNRTYIVASSNDGPTFTNFQNANYYSTAVDLRNGFMYAYEPLFLYDFFKPIEAANASIQIVLAWLPELEDAAVGRFVSFLRDEAGSASLL